MSALTILRASDPSFRERWVRPILHSALAVLVLCAAVAVPMPWTVHTGATHRTSIVGDGAFVTPRPATEQATLRSSLAAAADAEAVVLWRGADETVHGLAGEDLAGALAALDPTGQVVRDLRVATIGAVDAAGRVTAVDAIATHVALAVHVGADLVLVPAEQLGHVSHVVPAGVELAGVRTIHDALASIAAFRAGLRP